MKGMIILAKGFEDTEAVTTMDIIFRAGISLDKVNMGDDEKIITQCQNVMWVPLMYKDIKMEIAVDAFISSDFIKVESERIAAYSKISELKNNYVFLEDKVTKYALNPVHPRGKNKAKVFKSALGYTLDNYNDLIDNVYRKVDKDLFENQEPNEYGKKYKQIINITGQNGKNADILTGWILEKNGKYRLTTIYVK